MIKVVKGGKIDGEISAIPSKSYAHRIAICNFLAGNCPSAKCGEFSSNDIKMTEECLLSLSRGESVLDCGESGSTLRFLLPLCAVLGGEYEFIGHGKLMERPNEELFALFNAHGVSTYKDKTIKIKGKLKGNEFRIRGDISSQYVSGLLMALPILDNDSKIILTTPLVSAPYVDITLEVLKSFGVCIDRTDYGFFVKGKSRFLGEILPEGDWSNSAFFLVLGSIAGRMKVKGLNLSSVQGDRYIIEILKLAGANLSFGKDSVTVSSSKLRAFTFDSENCPDLVPIASVLASFADGVSVIKNIQRLKIKESDRIESTIAMLNSFGIKATSDGVNLTIYGGGQKAGVADSFNDHRIAMSASVIACGVNGESEIHGTQAVNKSYPTFFEDLQKVGGKVYNV